MEFMKHRYAFAVAMVGTVIASSACLAQSPASPDSSISPSIASGGIVVEWTPPAFNQLSTEASTRSSFTLDRSMLAAAASLMSDTDAETRQAMAKIDGVSVHLLRFAPDGVPNEDDVDAIRDAYHLRGWKHLVTTTDSRGPIHSGTTDLWLVMDGVNVRGAVALAETPKSVALITVSGNLSPIDILHLRGHFGIPRFDGDGFHEPRDRERPSN
jgi:hypothetical protein